MFLQNNSTTNSFLFVRTTQFLHFLRLHQMVYQLTLVVTYSFYHIIASSFNYFTAGLLIILITPTFLLLQDVLGKKDDEINNQKRIIFSAQTNKLLFYSSMSFMIIVLFLNDLASVFCFFMLLGTTISYAIAKHLRKMIISYFFRYCSSIFTILLYFYILKVTYSPELLYFIVAVSILDLIGNIAGDIRDEYKDSIAGVRTLVTVYGRDYTVRLMSFLMIMLFSFLLLEVGNPILVLLFIANLPCFLLLEVLPTKYSHGIFHLGKILNFLILSFIFTSITIFLLLIWLIFISFSWLVCYYFYLFNTGLSSHA